MSVNGYDNVLISLDSSITFDTVLPLLAALQGYEQGAEDKVATWNSQTKDPKFKRKCNLRLHIETPYAEMFQLILGKGLKHLGFLGVELTEAYSFYDMIAELSLERILGIANANNKSIAQSIGILIGSETDSLADVSGLCTEYQPGEFLYCDILTKCLLTEEIKHSISKFPVMLVVNPVHEDSVEQLEERIQTIFAAKYIVGQASFDTYLACCLKKPVVELNSVAYLHKWSNPNYICLDSITKSGFEKAINLCLTLTETQK